MSDSKPIEEQRLNWKVISAILAQLALLNRRLNEAESKPKANQ